MDIMIPETIKILSKVEETHDVFTYTFQKDGFEFKPGQFNMIYHFGVGEVPISFSGEPNEKGEFVHSIRNVGNVTNLLENLKEGDELGMRGPFGTPWPVEAAKGKDVILIAGGLGMAPLRPVIYEILKDRSSFKNVTLIFGARSRKEIVFEKEVNEWSENNIKVFLTVDKGSPSWKGHTGVVTKFIPKALLANDSVAFVCGPEIMMKASVRDLLAKDLIKDNIYVSLERNMKCAVGFCGHCQFGQDFICKDGPVFPFSRIEKRILEREI